MNRSSFVALVVVPVVACGCPRAASAPGSTSVSASSSASSPSGPFVAHPLDGPFASIAGWCKAAATKYEWGPDRRCRLDEPAPASAPSPSAAARVFLVDDLFAGGVHVATCHLAITTAAGTFVDGPDDPNDRCEGLIGPTTHLATTLDALAWSSGHLTMRTRETRAEGEWKENDVGPKTLTYAGAATDRLVLCSFSATGVPLCTPPIVVGCSDAQAPTHAHSLSWKLDGATLHLRTSEAASDLLCDSGAELVVGDFGLW